jgi:hypothetical protein
VVKEFGKLGAKDLRQLLALLPELEKQKAVFQVDARNEPVLRAAIKEEGVLWAPLYEYSFQTHLAIALDSLGIAEHVINAAKTDDPPATVLRFASDKAFLDGLRPKETLELWQAISIVLSIQRSLEALLVFGRYINELIKEAREGNDGSLFKAVRIDPSVVACPSVAIRISGATALQDASFFRALRNAMGGKTQKQARYLRGVRLVVQALHEAGVSSMSDRELVRLFDQSLGLYKQGANPGKALRKHFNAAQRK